MTINDTSLEVPASDAARIDDLRWHPKIQVRKYDPATVAALTAALGREPTAIDLAAVDPDDIAYDEGNQLTTAGLNRLGNLIIGTGSTPAFNASQAILGVGNSSTAFALGQTTLQGDGSTTTAWYQGADSAPTQSNGVISAQMTITGSNANFAWNEWGWIIGTGTITAGGTLASVATSPVLLNRKVASLGTKASGAIWVLQSTVTLS